MINTRRSAKFVALLAGSALVLAACATSEEPADDSAPEATSAAAQPPPRAALPQGGSDAAFSYGYEQEFFAYNNDQGDANASANAIVLNQINRGFCNYGPDGAPYADEDFGTYEVTSEDPLTVEYTFAEEAVWSDGEPIDCDDAVLVWTAQSGTFPEFVPAGTTGYENHAQARVRRRRQDLRHHYETPFADYAAQYGNVHAGARRGAERRRRGHHRRRGRRRPRRPVRCGRVLEHGFIFNPGEYDDDRRAVRRPVPGRALGGRPVDQLHGQPRVVGHPARHRRGRHPLHRPGRPGAGAAERRDPGDGPPAHPDLLAQLEAIGDSVTVEPRTSTRTSTGTSTSPVPFADPVLREAFALCLPRQTMVDNLIKPAEPRGRGPQQPLRLPFEEDYAGGRRGLLRRPVRAGHRGRQGAARRRTASPAPTLRLGHNANAAPHPGGGPDHRSPAAPTAPASTSVDIGNENFFEPEGELATGAFDVAQFAWSGSPLNPAPSSTFSTDGGNNNGKYTNPAGGRAHRPAQPGDRPRRADRPGHPDRDHPLGGPRDDPGLRVPGVLATTTTSPASSTTRPRPA